MLNGIIILRYKNNYNDYYQDSFPFHWASYYCCFTFTIGRPGCYDGFYLVCIGHTYTPSSYTYISAETSWHPGCHSDCPTIYTYILTTFSNIFVQYVTSSYAVLHFVWLLISSACSTYTVFLLLHHHQFLHHLFF